METCPFEPGDWVVYKPSQRGYDLCDGERLVIGKAYRVGRIQEENYVVVEGSPYPDIGIYWTEFERAADPRRDEQE